MHPHHARGAAAGLTALALLSPLLAATAADAATTSPDLTTTTVTLESSAVGEGSTFVVSHELRSTASVAAPASTTRFYLSPDPVLSRAERTASKAHPRSSWLDVRLTGQRPQAALAAASTAPLMRTRVGVPVGTPAGTWHVLACADDLGAVVEARETENCTAAAATIVVKAATGTSTLDHEAFAQTAPWAPAEPWSVQLLKSQCAAVVTPRTLTPAQSVANLRTVLARTSGADALAMVDGSPLADTADEAQALAAEGVLQGSPGLATAALLRAHALEPDNGTHLVNLAGLANAIGRPNEALGLLTGAATRTFATPAVGISQRAVALAVRGQALALTGRLDAARTSFTAARAAAPLLREADTGLATVAACTDDDAGAVRALRDGRQRREDRGETRPGPGLDLSLGRVSPLRVLPVPETSAAGVRMEPLYEGIVEGLGGETTAHSEEATRLADQMAEGDLTRSRAEVRRRSDVVDLAASAWSEPALTASRTTFETAATKLRKQREAFFGGDQGGAVATVAKLDAGARTACRGSTVPYCFEREMTARCRPALDSAHATWRTQLATAQEAGTAYYTALSTRMSAYAANLATPEARGIVLQTIAEHETSTYGRLAMEAKWWTLMEQLHEELCVAPAAAEVPAAPTPGEVDAEEGCPARLKGIDFVFELGPSTVKANCEKVEQEFELEVAPLVGAFVETTYDHRAGSITVFAGGKLGDKVGGVVDAGFKSGIYVSMDTKTGEFSDIGWRVGPKVTAGTAHLEVTALNQEMDLSFVSGMQGLLGG